jgi:non-canonical purine NTP pyrophosphatase (RdgB/HAM1 family)
MHRRITGKLVIATHNPGKLAEMRELLAPHGVEAVSAGDLGLSEPEETGETFRANAAIKAIAAAKATGLPAFADDSGLVVDALDGAPGIYSARWAGETKDFTAAMTRIERLLQERGNNAKRISSRLCASPGPTIISKRSRRAPMELWCGHRAGPPGSATIRPSCRMDTRVPSAR